jgi:hypothetical protein
VIWIPAIANIAVVANHETFWDFALEERIGKTMNTNILAFVIYTSITVVDDLARILPATRLRVHRRFRDGFDYPFDHLPVLVDRLTGPGWGGTPRTFVMASVARPPSTLKRNGFRAGFVCELLL